MHKTAKVATLSLLTAAFLSSVSYAADVYGKGSLKDDTVPGVRVQNWNGVYIGGQLGAGSTTIGLDDGQGGIAADGLVGGLRVGADIARGSLLFGIFGEYNWSDEALELGPLNVLQQDHDWAAMARVGLIHGNTLFYGAGGYTVVTYSSGLASGDVDLDGWKAAIGIEHAIAPNFTLALEASRSWLDADEAFGSGAEDVIDVTDDRIMVRGSYKINGSTFGF